MNLTTRYLGLELSGPLTPGACPLVNNMDNIRRLQDAGASAIVMHSLYAEQIDRDEAAFATHVERWSDQFPEASSLFPSQDEYALGPDDYLERIATIKAATRLPIIASLNGSQPGTWTGHARLIEQAGADALELNTYLVAADRDVSGEELECRLLEIVRDVRKAVSLPISVKLSPYYTSIAHVVGRLEQEGVQGVVLFNRFFQPEIDLETLEVFPRLNFSRPEELRLRLRWIGMLHGQIKPSIACSGGVHTADDVVKALLAGADTVQVVSALLANGPEYLGVLLDGLKAWMESQEYESIEQLKGALSMRHCPDPAAYERGNYLRSLQLWRE